MERNVDGRQILDLSSARMIDVEPCPLCQGDLPDDLVGKIRSAEPGKPMTLDEAEVWLREIGWNGAVAFDR